MSDASRHEFPKMVLTFIAGIITTFGAIYIANLQREGDLLITDRQVEGRLVEKSIDILVTSPPSGELRQWARAVINRHSEVKLSEAAAFEFLCLGEPLAMIDLGGEPQYFSVIEGTPISVPALNIRRLSAEFLGPEPEPGARLTIEYCGQKDPVKLILLKDNLTPVIAPISRTPYRLRLVELDPAHKLVILQTEILRKDEAPERSGV